MLYLIGGAPRCGKTIVAKRLAEEMHVPWFPADYLTAVVGEYVADENKFPLRTIRQENKSNDYLYSKHSPKEIVSFYNIQAETVWPGINAFIEYALHDKQDFIIEGYQIQPHMLSMLQNSDNSQHIHSAFLYKEDLTDIENGLMKNESADWVNTNTEDKATLIKIAQMTALFGEATKIDAQKYNMPLFNMDGDFQEKIDLVARHFQK